MGMADYNTQQMLRVKCFLVFFLILGETIAGAKTKNGKGCKELYAIFHTTNFK
jgi:hypothetical protein